MSGIWIIALVIYFVFFFFWTITITTARAELSTNEYYTGNQPGAFDKGNVFVQGGYCTGNAKLRWEFNGSSFENIMYCSDLSIPRDSADGTFLNDAQCTDVSPCSATNRTSLFGGTSYVCTGTVNTTLYALNTSSKSEFCESSYLSSEQLCSKFTCTWVDIGSIGDSDPSIKTGGEIWNTIKWITTFSYDFEAGQYNWLMSLVFFYLPFIMLLWAVYRSLPLVGFGG